MIIISIVFVDKTGMSDLQSTFPTDSPDTKSPASKSDDIIEVLIAGAGIGGLVTALCLHRAGYTVRIHERFKKLDTNGFGISLQPYSVKLLYELGLEKELSEIGLHCDSMEFYSSHGKFICREPAGIKAGFRWPMYSVHRGHLQQLLFRRVREEMGESVIRLSQKLLTFRSQSNFVEVDFVDPDTGKINTEVAKVLIGAEGINSTVRKILYPDEGPPLWDGVGIWRGVASVDELFLDGRTLLFLGNPNDRKLVIYPVNKHLVNWQISVRVEPPGIRPVPSISDWNTLGKIQDILPLFASMKVDFIDLNQLISSSMIDNEFMMTDRDPLPRWSHDRVTLLGDAAHPMYPIGGNGASQAITDARFLVLAFREHGVNPQGLRTYDETRRTASYIFVQSARQNGPEKILQIVDERSPSTFSDLSEVITPSELKIIGDNNKLLPGWDAEKLNEEVPLF